VQSTNSSYSIQFFGLFSFSRLLEIFPCEDGEDDDQFIIAEEEEDYDYDDDKLLTQTR